MNIDKTSISYHIVVCRRVYLVAQIRLASLFLLAPLLRVDKCSILRVCLESEQHKSASSSSASPDSVIPQFNLSFNFNFNTNRQISLPLLHATLPRIHETSLTQWSLDRSSLEIVPTINILHPLKLSRQPPQWRAQELRLLLPPLPRLYQPPSTMLATMKKAITIRSPTLAPGGE